jgi:hypothetical protein
MALRRATSATALILGFGLAMLGPAGPAGAASPAVAGCPVLPADNIWNVRVDGLPVAANSASYVSSIGSTRTLHPVFGAGMWDGGPIGMPFVTVPGSQPRVPIAFDYDDESDPGPYPIPANPPIEGGSASDGDRHVLIVDTAKCFLYELFNVYPHAGGGWRAGSGAVFDLRSNALRPDTWTSADAAGLPILPGLVRYDEVASGEIRHALRFTAPVTQKRHVWPARHDASSNTSTGVPPMGQRFRLKASFDVSGFPPAVQVVLTALKRYGMMLADNGSPWFLSGAPDPRWNDDELVSGLHRVPGSAFEAVDVSSLMIAAGSGQAKSAPSSPAPPPPLPPPPVKTYTLTVKVTGGAGTVTSAPAGVSCTAGACGASFPSGTRVTLTVKKGTLRDWSGDCGGRGACVVTMTKNRSVTARFR